MLRLGTRRLDDSGLSAQSFRMILRAAFLISALTPMLFAQDSVRNVWARQYRERSAADIAAQFEQPSRPVFRERETIIRLLDLRPGMVVAEIGACDQAGYS